MNAAGIFIKKFLLMLVFVCAASSALARENYSDFNQSGYFLTADLYPLGKGYIQVYFIPSYARNDFFFDNNVTLPLEIDIGITNDWYIFFNWPAWQYFNFSFAPSVNGIGDLIAGSQLSFMDIRQRNIDIGFLLVFSIPIANVNKGLTDGFLRIIPSLQLAFDNPHGNSWLGQLFFQFGKGIITRLKKSSFGALSQASSELIINCGYAIKTKSASFSVELNWQHQNIAPGVSDNLFLTPGFFYVFRSNVEIGLGVPIGLTKESNRYGVIFDVDYFFKAF